MVYFYVRPSLVSSLVLVFLLFDASSYAAKVMEVDAICKKTTNPPFCSKILNSKPGGATGADLVTLGQYTIGVVHANFTNTIKLIKSLIANASDPPALHHYKTCLTEFSYGEDALVHIEQMLKSGDYSGATLGAMEVARQVDECIRGEPSPSDVPPYHDTSLLPKYASVARQIVEIIRVIHKDIKKSCVAKVSSTK